jgi:hypothetical protein
VKKVASITTVIVLNILLAMSALSHGYDLHGGPGQCFNVPANPETMMLTKYMNDNMATDVLAKLTGKSIENVSKDMKTGNMMELLRSYNVDLEVFRKNMDAKMTETLKTMAGCGLLTKAQADDIIEKSRSRPAPPPHDMFMRGTP